MRSQSMILDPAYQRSHCNKWPTAQWMWRQEISCGCSKDRRKWPDWKWSRNKRNLSNRWAHMLPRSHRTRATDKWTCHDMQRTEYPVIFKEFRWPSKNNKPYKKRDLNRKKRLKRTISTWRRRHMTKPWGSYTRKSWHFICDSLLIFLDACIYWGF